MTAKSGDVIEKYLRPHMEYGSTQTEPIVKKEPRSQKYTHV